MGNDDLDVADTKYNLATLIKGQVRNLYPSSDWCRTEAPRSNVCRGAQIGASRRVPSVDSAGVYLSLASWR